jgi:anti-anti-sigma factor
MPILPKHIRYDKKLSRTHSLECGDDYDVLGFNDRRYVDTLQIQELKSELLDYIDRTQSNLCLNLKGVEFLATAVLNGMILVDRELKRSKRKELRLMNISPEINEVLVQTRLDQMFDLYDLRRT